MTSNRQCFTFALIVGVCLAVVVSVAETSPSMPSQNGYYNEMVEEQPEEALMELIARFGQTLMRNREEAGNAKRTVDFGLARGFSGMQEAKHRMGLAAANFAGGPGRKRRSAIQD